MEKKLYRIKEGALMFGVCTGLAEYFGVDVNLVRLAAIAAACAGGLGVVVYAAAVLLLPER